MINLATKTNVLSLVSQFQYLIPDAAAIVIRLFFIKIIYLSTLL